MVHYEQTFAPGGISLKRRYQGYFADLKNYTRKQMSKAIVENKSASHEERKLQIFKKQGEKNNSNMDYQFWHQDNQPNELFSIAFTWQKMNSQHSNPLEAGLDEKAAYYLHCSAATMLEKERKY
jgi:hypothetical protein